MVHENGLVKQKSLIARMAGEHRCSPLDPCLDRRQMHIPESKGLKETRLVSATKSHTTIYLIN